MHPKDLSTRFTSSLRGLHCMWLVPRRRASFDGMDDSDWGEWIHLKRGVDCGGCGPRAELGSGLCPWSPTVALHDLLNLGRRSCANVSRFAQTSQLRLKPSCRLARDGQGPSKPLKAYKLVPRGTQMSYLAAVDLVAELGASQDYVVIISSYSIKEIVPKREPILVIDLSDDESVEGLEMAPVAPGIGLGTSIEEDPSEPTSNSEMTPEPKRVAPAAAWDMGTFVADSLPVTASPTPIPPGESVSSFPALASLLQGRVREHDICGYCLWREQRVEAAGQQIMELREEISRIDSLLYTSRQAHQ
ncbi:hypothetical protein M9H77_23645 [Catharanthus roseus]|uniref:Uncharacterized protein n=1 Tax=Catharanthus roseus TaxID=4058 RepID=A0ACC0AWE7_CATRO|nr:hypothetical protein M9H77_23645 [Catharanthus roseus]